jgi:subtilisin family serine protease
MDLVMNNQLKATGVGANDVQSVTNLNGSGVKVAIIDTGVNINAPYIRNNIYYGRTDYYNFNNFGYGYDFANKNTLPFDYDGHGTHVAGIVKSVAKNVTLIPLRVFSDNGYTDRFEIIKAAKYAMKLGARIINLSLGGLEPAQLDQNFWNDMFDPTAAFAKNVLFIVSAGNFKANNDLNSYFPANVNSPNLISVCATNKYGQLTDFSHYGKNSVDICSLGEQVMSLSLDGKSLVALDGTSMAAPFVSGVAALILQANPNLSPSQVKEIITTSATKSLHLLNANRNAGHLNADAALRKVLKF